jgi:Domain of unknown function (DUF397)
MTVRTLEITMERKDSRPVDDDVIMPWRKASYSNTGANCVEAASTRNGMVAVRDSKDPEGPTLTFTVEEWGEFVGKVRRRELES